MTVTLPIPPTVNHLHTVARGRKIKSKRAREYASEVAWLMLSARRRDPYGWTPGPGERLRVRANFYPKDHRRVDIDNYAKALLDSVFACLGDADDWQIDSLTLVRMPPDKLNPRVVLTLEAL